MAESIQDKLTRVRPPRVQITYDVETGGAIEKKELPLVVAIMADLAGKADPPLPFMKVRKFVEIDRDNFNDVLASLNPRVAFQVDSRLEEGEKKGEEGEKATEKEGGSKLNVELRFRHLDDFNPEAVVQQIEPLRKLFEARQRLNDLVGKLDGNDDLDGLLQEIASNTEQQQEIQKATTGGESDG